MTSAQLARMIDHTQLRPYATEIDIAELCEEAAQYGFSAVSINPVWTSFCSKKLAGTGVGINTCIAFPLGAISAKMKIEEACEAVRKGATEIDMVINIGALKSGYSKFVEREIEAVVNSVKGIPLKVILETSYLTENEKREVCAMSMRSGASFVKTSTGYGDGGATVEDVRLMKEVVGDRLGIKAAGGIRTYGDAMGLIKAGASRLGTSAGLKIIEDAPE